MAYTQAVLDVVLAAGKAQVTARAFESRQEINAVISACDAGLCALVPMPTADYKTYLFDRAWNIKTAIKLTNHGERVFEKADWQRAS